MFCYGCILKWSRRPSSCPLCKKKFSTVSEHFVETAQEALTKRSSYRSMENVLSAISLRAQALASQNGHVISRRKAQRSNNLSVGTRQYHAALASFGAPDASVAPSVIRVSSPPPSPERSISYIELSEVSSVLSDHDPSNRSVQNVTEDEEILVLDIAAMHLNSPIRVV